MSSILDALNKLEEDRAAQQAEPEDINAPFEPEAAAAALIGEGRRKRPQKNDSRLAPWKVALGGVLLLAVISALSAGIAMALINRAAIPMNAPGIAAAKPQETYTAPAPVETVIPIQSAPKPTVTAPQETKLPKVAEKPAPVETPVAKKPEPPVETPVAKKPETVNAPEPVKVVETPLPPQEPAKAAEPAPPPPPPTPKTEPVKAAAPPPAPEPPESIPLPSSFPVASVAPSAVPAAAKRKQELPVDIASMPRLSANDRTRLGLGELRLNVLREASATQPEALAIINLKKVYVGEMIPGTRARLIAVESRAIGIEIDETGERFKVSN